MPLPPTVFPELNHSVFSNDGDALQFCTTCAFSNACLAEGMDKTSLMALHVMVEHIGPFHEGDVIFRQGDPFHAIAAVRAGSVKTLQVDRTGRAQIQGFHLPGEVIGLSAVEGERYPCSAIALDTVMLCRFSFPQIATLAMRLPGLQAQLFRLMGRDIQLASQLRGDYDAAERLAAFLVAYSRRLQARGFSPSRFQLTMTRLDVANYLRMTGETLSRTFRRFQQSGWIAAAGRDVEIVQREPLEALALPILDT